MKLKTTDFGGNIQALGSEKVFKKKKNEPCSACPQIILAKCQISVFMNWKNYKNQKLLNKGRDNSWNLQYIFKGDKFLMSLIQL